MRRKPSGVRSAGGVDALVLDQPLPELGRADDASPSPAFMRGGIAGGRLGGAEHPVPGGAVEAGQAAGLGHRRHVGQRRHPLARRHRQAAHRPCWIRPIAGPVWLKKKSTSPAQQRLHRAGLAAIGHVHQVEPARRWRTARRPDGSRRRCRSRHSSAAPGSRAPRRSPPGSRSGPGCLVGFTSSTFGTSPSSMIGVKSRSGSKGRRR